MRRLLVAVFVVLSACGGGSSNPGGPSPSPSLNVAGTWTGPGSDSSGPGTFTWILNQNGNNVSGTARVSTQLGTVTGNGTISGTIVSGSMNWTINIPRGGITAPYQNCTDIATGTTTSLTSSRMVLSYAGTNSCTGNYVNGTETLTKQ